mgnify:CR=1 FL=1
MKKIIYFPIPVTLCIVAITQIYLAKTSTLTPWKGGGFGMFTVVDSISSRSLGCEMVNLYKQEGSCLFNYRKINFWRSFRSYPKESDFDLIMNGLKENHPDFLKDNIKVLKFTLWTIDFSYHTDSIRSKKVTREMVYDIN